VPTIILHIKLNHLSSEPHWHPAVNPLCQSWAQTFHFCTTGHGLPHVSDTGSVRRATLQRETAKPSLIPWAIQVRAICQEEPGRLVQTLTGAILGCGGWVLSRSASDSGAVNLLFEFERRACVDMYGILIAAGVELSPNGHVRFTELCQCTLHDSREHASEIASIDLEIQTFLIETGDSHSAQN
jgi:hypothetical protein